MLAADQTTKQPIVSDYLIHIPQGRCGRLHKASSSYNITGLHTDGFSTCNIIICINQDRISLTHCDLKTNPSEIKDEIGWVGQPCDVIIIRRKESDILSTYLLKYLSKELPTHNIIVKIATNEIDGTIVTFKASETNSMHPNITMLSTGIRPDNLLHHPDEQRFLAIQKIRQVIGMRELMITNKLRTTQQMIFDGRAWEPINQDEVVINTTHRLTREELNSFKNTDTFITIAGKIMGLIESVKNRIPLHGDLKEITFQVAFYLESYLNDYNTILIFKRNLLDVVDNDIFKPESKDDKNYKQQLVTLLKSNEQSIEKFSAIMKSYQEEAQNTGYKKQILDEYSTILRHYNQRNYYFVIQRAANVKLERAEKTKQYAMERYTRREFDAAANLFLDVLKIFSCFYLKDNPKLASAYYNCGRSLQFAEQHQEALFFLKTAHTMRINYVRSSPQDIEKVKSAIDECEKSISMKNKSEHAPTHTASP